MDAPAADDARADAAPPATPAPRRRGCARLLALGLALVVALALAEGGLRLAGKGHPVRWPLVCERPELYEGDERIGYRLHPGLRTTYLYPRDAPRRLAMRANSDGFRGERELASADTRPRVVLLGDSFTFGEGVEEPERFGELVEAAEPAWRVDNLGMTGFGPDLMLRALESFGVALRPAAVVMCVYTDDLRRVRPDFAGVGFPVPRYRVEGDRLVSVPYPVPSFLTRLHLVQTTRDVVWNASGLERRINELVLERWRGLAREHRFAPALVFVPGRSDLAADKERRAWLAAWAARADVPFTDLTEPIQREGDRVFIPGNPHLNPAGHAVVATHLRTFLAETAMKAR